jgi:hypothetical protein
MSGGGPKISGAYLDHSAMDAKSRGKLGLGLMPDRDTGYLLQVLL